MMSEPFGYKAGGTVPGEFEDCSIDRIRTEHMRLPARFPNTMR